jgi:hypothetical protein
MPINFWTCEVANTSHHLSTCDHMQEEDGSLVTLPGRFRNIIHITFVFVKFINKLPTMVSKYLVLCRYNPNKGELKLVSEKYPSSEENRQHVMELLYKLIQEGERKYPRPSPEGGQAGEEAATVS